MDSKTLLRLARYNNLCQKPKNIKCPGVVRKLKRQLRKAGINV